MQFQFKNIKKNMNNWKKTPPKNKPKDILKLFKLNSVIIMIDNVNVAKCSCKNHKLIT